MRVIRRAFSRKGRKGGRQGSFRSFLSFEMSYGTSLTFVGGALSRLGLFFLIPFFSVSLGSGLLSSDLEPLSTRRGDQSSRRPSEPVRHAYRVAVAALRDGLSGPTSASTETPCKPSFLFRCTSKKGPGRCFLLLETKTWARRWWGRRRQKR
jgi:hypothetical protein